MNQLFYGDNLEVLRQSIPDESVDLVYLDPPFNSNRNYNVLFGHHVATGGDDAAQIQAFGDTWVWTPTTDQQFAGLMAGEIPAKAADALSAFRALLDRNDAMAYLVNMTPRLVELHRVLKPTGSLYLHCDPTMSHYLKIMLDAVFGPANFRNDIVWKRKAGRGETQNAAIRFGVSNDTILFYAKSAQAKFVRQYRESNPEYIASKFTHVEEASKRRYRLDNLTSPSPRPNLVYEYKGYNPPPNGWAVSRARMEEMDAQNRLYLPAKKTARIQRKRYLDELEGETVDSIWDDIPPINSQAKERLGYPTQKPVALLERILAASSVPDTVVLDPFCGCGTTIDAAIKLGRKWIGIDVTYIAVDLIEKRLRHTYGDDITKTYQISGIPRDKAAALALFSQSPFDFERWAVSMVDGQPNQKQVGDKGIDGVARFPLDARRTVGRVLISVKGGRQLNPSMVRDLGGTVATQRAEMGVLITNGAPTRGMTDEANHAGTYQHPHYAEAFPRIQIITVDELLSGKRPKMPPTMLPYIQATRGKTPVDQGTLFDA